MRIIDQEVITAAGLGKERLWEALLAGRDCSSYSEKEGLGLAPVCLIQEAQQKLHTARWAFYLETLWSKLLGRFSSAQIQVMRDKKVGVVFTSTKGIVEDILCSKEKIQDLNEDPYFPILSQFSQQALQGWRIERALCISHACASAHVGLEQVDFWIRNRICDFVILISGDLIGRFIFQGFQSLKILTSTKCRPFSDGRDGLQLGEACSIMLLAPDDLTWETSVQIRVHSVKSESEGVSVTRPSMNGKSLIHAIEKLDGLSRNLDLVVAHGTGTQFNDLSEDQAFQSLKQHPPVTGCKWAVGHTLGASGAIDVMAACMAIQHQTAFRIKNTLHLGSGLKGNYLLSESQSLPNQIHSVLVTSLGFGGIHGALLLEG